MSLRLDEVRYRHAGEGGEQQYVFDLTVEPGTIAAVMGESGAGKSTLLDLVAGFIMPSSGSISWNGKDILRLSPAERPVTIVFQANNHFPHLDAFTSVALGLNGGRRLEEDQRAAVAEALAEVGLSGRGGDLVSRLSGGQQQRVALARAIVRPQPVVLLDEPFNGLDDRTRRQMLDLVGGLAKRQGRAVVVVTHDKRDADALDADVYSISGGRLFSETGR